MYKYILMMFLSSLIAGVSFSANNYHVSLAGDGTDGSTWEKAFTTLQTAADSAGDFDTIRVAAEIFTGDSTDLIEIYSDLIWMGGYDSLGTDFSDSRRTGFTKIDWATKTGPMSKTYGIFKIGQPDTVDMVLSRFHIVNTGTMVFSTYTMQRRFENITLENCMFSCLSLVYELYSGTFKCINTTIYSSAQFIFWEPRNVDVDIDNTVFYNCTNWQNDGFIANEYVDYSCFNNCGFSSPSGIGNIEYYPFFVDTSSSNYILLSISPCIDAGNLSDSYSNEPSPNGCRINVGAYGNTDSATTAAALDFDVSVLSSTSIKLEWHPGEYGWADSFGVWCQTGSFPDSANDSIRTANADTLLKFAVSDSIDTISGLNSNTSYYFLLALKDSGNVIGWSEYPRVGMKCVTTTWVYTFGGISGQTCGYEVQPTYDNGYVYCGFTRAFGAGQYDVWVIKADSSGDSSWSTLLGGASTEFGFSTKQTLDSGYIVSASTESYGTGGEDFWLVKLNSSGDTAWTRTYGGNGNERGIFIKEDEDSSYSVVGYTSTYGAGSDDYWLLKIDKNGDTLWTKTYGGGGSDNGLCFDRTYDGGYILVGQTASYGAGGFDVWLVRTDSTGDTLWTKAYGSNSDDQGRFIKETPDSGFIITGYTSYGAGGLDVWLIKTDSNGDTLWTRTFGGSQEDRAFSLDQTNDGGFILTGLTNSYGSGDADLYLIKSDADGDLEWSNCFGGTEYDRGRSVIQDSDNNYIILGQTQSFGGTQKDMWCLKVSADGEGGGSPKTMGKPMIFSNNLKSFTKIYPNPFKDDVSVSYEIKPEDINSQSSSIIVRFRVYNRSGRVVNDEQIYRYSAGNYTFRWNGKDHYHGVSVDKGVYYYEIIIGNKKDIGKIMLMR